MTIDIAIPRLFAYHRALAAAPADGKSVITSLGLAALLGHTARPARSRVCDKTVSSAARARFRIGTGLAHRHRRLRISGACVCDLHRSARAALQGGGNLRSVAGVVGQPWQDLRVQAIDELETVLSGLQCNIGVIAVPAAAAQSVAERLAAQGVRALLNFAPASLRLREPVMVRNIDLAGELSILTHRLMFEEPSQAG